MSKMEANSKPKLPKVDLIGTLKPYRLQLVFLFILAIMANGASLAVPKLISDVIDNYQQNPNFQINNSIWILVLAALAAVSFTFIQSLLSVYASEKLAFDLRQKIIDKISKQTFGFVNKLGGARILTNLTSDVDKVKMLISQGIITAFSAVLILVGASILLLTINWQLALIALTVIPLIALTFGLIFGRIGKLFAKAQVNLEQINGIINESILGATLIRVLNSQASEVKKFSKVNQEGRTIRLGIVYLFSSMIPIVTLLSNLATLSIIWFGGNQVIDGSLSLGEFSAFFAYLSMLIFPIFLLGFISSSLSSSVVSLGRINEILESSVETHKGGVKAEIKGNLELKNICLELDNQNILKNVSFEVKAASKTAILGPTAAGKTQIFNLIAGLNKPTSGEILLDNRLIDNYDRDSLYSQMGLVFQDSIIFNTTLRENIEFRQRDIGRTETIQNQIVDNNKLKSDQNSPFQGGQGDVQKAITTSALDAFIDTLPEGLDTMIDERGTNLSGGQKQRLMLARALAINPKLLLLDDFTARVDINTEQKILSALSQNYPDLTLISITQKIEPIKDYDQIIVIMEGELIAKGKHEELLQTSLEYQQIWQSQQSVEG